MKTINKWKALLMSAAMLVSGAMVSCEKDKGGQNLDAEIEVTASKTVVDKGDEITLAVQSNTTWTVSVTKGEDYVASYNPKAGSKNGVVTVKIADKDATPGTAVEFLFEAKGYFMGYEFPESETVKITIGEKDGDDTDDGVEATAVTIAEFIAAPVSDTQVYELVGTIDGSASINTQYGNFDLKDETGTVYVYGLSSNPTSGPNAKADQTFANMGIGAGSKIKIKGYRGEYNSKVEVMGAWLVAILDSDGDGDGDDNQGDTPGSGDAEITAGEYYMFGVVSGAYHAWDGSAPYSGQLQTAEYSYDAATKTFTIAGDPGFAGVAAKITLEEAGEGAFYIKSGDNYLYSTAAENHKLAFGEDTNGKAWTFTAHSAGGYLGHNNGVVLGTAKGATSRQIRAYVTEGTPEHGIELIPVGDVTIKNGQYGSDEEGDNNGDDDGNDDGDDNNGDSTEVKVVTVEEFLAASVSETQVYQLTGVVTSISNAEYGNLNLKDDTGTIYVYGLTKEYVASNDQSFSSLGVEEGDKITINGYRADYQGTAQVGSAWLVKIDEKGAVVDDTYYTLTPEKGGDNGYATDSDLAIGGITWNITGNSDIVPWRVGGKDLSKQDRAIYSKTPIAGNISKIAIDHGTATIEVNSFKVIVAKDANFSNVVAEFTPNYKASDIVTIEKTDSTDWSNCYYKFVYNVTTNKSNTNQYLQFTKAKFYE